MQAPELVRRAVQRVAASDRFGAMAPKVIPPMDRALAKVTRGRVLLSQWIVPSIILHTTGAKSGQSRESSLATVPHDGDLYVVGSNFGQESHPAWSYNLIAHPRASVTMHGKQRPVDSVLLGPDEKAAIWPALTKAWPPYDRYVERSGRDLRVFRLTWVD